MNDTSPGFSVFSVISFMPGRKKSPGHPPELSCCIAWHFSKTLPFIYITYALLRKVRKRHVYDLTS